MLGDMSEHWSVFLHKHKKKLASCGTPSFPERNVMHGNILNRLLALDFTLSFSGKCGYRASGGEPFQSQRIISSAALPCMVMKPRDLEVDAPEKYSPSRMVDNDCIWLAGQPYHRRCSVKS